MRQGLRHAERVPRARHEALLRRRSSRSRRASDDQGQLDRRVGLRAVHAHQRVAGRGFHLRPGARGGVHRQRDAGELQGGGGPRRERLLRGVGDRGRRPARGVHRRPTTRTERNGDGNAGDVFVGQHARRPGAPRLAQRADLGLRTVPGRRSGRRAATSSRSTNPATPTGGDFRKVYSGNSTYKDNFAAGTAFIVIRRSDAEGPATLQARRPRDDRDGRAGYERVGVDQSGRARVRAVHGEPGVDRGQHGASGRAASGWARTPPPRS